MWQYFLKMTPKNTQTTHFSPKYKEFLIFLEDLQFEKLEGVNFKYDLKFFKFPPKNPDKAFRSQSILQSWTKYFRQTLLFM